MPARRKSERTSSGKRCEALWREHHIGETQALRCSSGTSLAHNLHGAVAGAHFVGRVGPEMSVGEGEGSEEASGVNGPTSAPSLSIFFIEKNVKKLRPRRL